MQTHFVLPNETPFNFQASSADSESLGISSARHTHKNLTGNRNSSGSTDEKLINSQKLLYGFCVTSMNTITILSILDTLTHRLRECVYIRINMAVKVMKLEHFFFLYNPAVFFFYLAEKHFSISRSMMRRRWEPYTNILTHAGCADKLICTCRPWHFSYRSRVPFLFFPVYCRRYRKRLSVVNRSRKKINTTRRRRYKRKKNK